MNRTKYYSCKMLLPSLFVAAILALSGCAFVAPVVDEIDPYGQGNTVAALGSRDSSAVKSASGGGSQEAQRARHALEVLGAYQRAQAPQPTRPVVLPAVVRLMWIPDHLNGHGDLVPPHYYFLRVLPERFAVQDAYESEQILRNGPGGINSVVGGAGGVPAAAGPPQSFGTGNSGSSSTPWVYKDAR